MTMQVKERAVKAEAADTIRYALGTGKFGRVLVARSAVGVCAVLFGDDDAALVADLGDRFAGVAIAPDAPALADDCDAVLSHIEKPKTAFDRTLDMGGTPFQRRVWRALCAIPAGRTASYADIAAQIGAPQAARAVARACAANRLAVLVPCHRVVRRDGGLSGYRWGAARKRALLAHESLAHESLVHEAAIR